MGVDLTSIRSPDFSTNQVTTARCLLATGGPSGVLLRGIVKATPQPQKRTARIQVRRGSRTAAMEAVATEGPGWLVFWKLLGRLQLLSHQDVKENMMQHFLFCVLVCVGNWNHKNMFFTEKSHQEHRIYCKTSAKQSKTSHCHHETTSVQALIPLSQNAIKTQSQKVQLFKKS